MPWPSRPSAPRHAPALCCPLQSPSLGLQRNQPWRCCPQTCPPLCGEQPGTLLIRWRSSYHLLKVSVPLSSNGQQQLGTIHRRSCPPLCPPRRRKLGPQELRWSNRSPSPSQRRWRRTLPLGCHRCPPLSPPWTTPFLRCLRTRLPRGTLITHGKTTMPPRCLQSCQPRGSPTRRPGRKRALLLLWLLSPLPT